MELVPGSIHGMSCKLNKIVRVIVLKQSVLAYHVDCLHLICSLQNNKQKALCEGLVCLSIRQLVPLHSDIEPFTESYWKILILRYIDLQ
jgi:hypothetical protein